MKNLLLVLFALLLFSCDNEPTKVENPQKETTVEILALANADTTFVKVVEIADVTYVVNNGVVTHKVSNESGVVATLGLILIAIMFVILIIAFVLSE